MKKIIIVTLMFPMLTNAQNNFLGICKSKKDNEPPPGTTMDIKGAHRSTVADSNGLIRISNIAAG